MYKSQISKLCSQIETLRIKSGIRANHVDGHATHACLPKSLVRITPGSIAPYASLSAVLDCVPSALDGDSLTMVKDLQILSIKLSELEVLILDKTDGAHKSRDQSSMSHECVSGLISNKIKEIMKNLSETKHKGKLVHFSLVEEEQNICQGIEDITNSINEYNKISTKYQVNTSNNKLANSLQNIKIKETIPKPNKTVHNTQYKLNELNIWDPVECIMLEKICHQYKSDKTRLFHCKKLMPSKTQVEILSYIAKFQIELIKKNKVKQEISNWKQMQVKKLLEDSQSSEKKDYKILNKVISSKKTISNPAFKKSINRLSQVKSCPVKMSITKPVKDLGYTCEERLQLQHRLNKYKKSKNINKTLVLHPTITKENRLKVRNNILNFQERDKQYIIKKKKAQEERNAKYINIIKKVSINQSYLRERGENSFMKPTLSQIFAIKAQTKAGSFSSAVVSVDTIPKRKTPDWKS